MNNSDVSNAIREVDKVLSQQINDIKIISTTSALILTVCLVDTLSGFFAGKSDTKNDGGIAFDNFAQKYLPKYSLTLRKFRNGLVHSMHNVHNYFFIQSEEFNNAFPGLKNILGHELFQVEEFKSAVYKAYEEYIQDISDLGNTDLRTKFLNRYDSLGIIKSGVIGVVKNFSGKIIQNVNDLERVPGSNIGFGITDTIDIKK